MTKEEMITEIRGINKNEEVTLEFLSRFGKEQLKRYLDDLRDRDTASWRKIPSRGGS